MSLTPRYDVLISNIAKHIVEPGPNQSCFVFKFSVDHRVVLSLEVADFGQVSPSGNLALDATSHWSDRLRLSTECRGDDVSFFVEIFVDTKESFRLCLQRDILVRTKRQMDDHNSTKTMSQQVLTVASKHDFYSEASKDDVVTVESENDVLKSTTSTTSKSAKTRKNDRIKFSVELVSGCP